MPKRAQRKIASFLLIVQLFFSLLAPFSPFISQVVAQEQTSSANFSEFSTHSLGFSLDGNMLMVNSDQNELDYSYYYLYEGAVQNARDQLSSGENALYVGLQSGLDFIEHNFEQMVFKAQRGDVIYSYYLHKQDDGLAVSQILASDSLELTADEQDWLGFAEADDWLVDEATRTAVTAENVELNVEYVFPLNDKVSVTFTRLPEETTVLTIREVMLSEELAGRYGTDTAYDITTEMEDGDFEYDLSLPKPDSVEGNDAEVVYADTEDDLVDDEKVQAVETERDGEQLVEVDEDAGVVRARKLEHMTVFVVSGGNDTNGSCNDVTLVSPGEGDSCYETIQAAINAAEDGDTIHVAAGTYNPFKVIEKNNLTIQATGVVTVEGVQVVSTNYGDRDTVVLVDDSTNIVLDGLTVGPNTGQSLTQPKDYGIIYENSSGQIKNCTVSPNTSGDMASSAIGIWDSSNVTIDACTINNFGRIGVFIYNGCAVNILGGSIEGQVYSGENEVCYGVEVEGASNNATPGTGSQVTIDGVEIYNCDNTFATGPSYVSGGVYINGWMGYYNEDDSTVTIKNCDIYDNYIGILAIKSPSSSAHSNNIYDNRVYGVESMAAYDGSTAVFDATNNWWGSSDGPSGEGPGTGDAISENVEYCPWLDAEGGESFGPCIDDEKPVMDSIEYLKNSGSITEQGTATDPVYVKAVSELSYNASFSDDLKLGKHVFVIYQENPTNPGTPYWVGSGGKAYCSFNGTDNTFSLEGTSDSLTDISFENCTSELPEGRYVVVNRVYDAVGKLSESYDLTFVVDNTTPVSNINIVGNLDETKNFNHNDGWHGGGWYHDFTEVKLSITSGSELDGNEKIQYQILDNEVDCPAILDNPTEIPSGTNIASAVNLLTDGVYTLCYQAKDSADNLEPIKKEVLKLDRTKPEYEILTSTINGSEVNGVYYIPSDTIKVNVHGEDEHSGYFRTRYDLFEADENWNCSNRISNGVDLPNAVGDATQTLSLSGLEDGRYCMQIWVYDDVQNKSWVDKNGLSTIHFVVDNTDPTGSIDYIYYPDSSIAKDYFITNDNTPILGGTCSDQNLGSVTIKMDGQTETIACNTGTWRSNEFSTLEDGTYTATLTLIDKAGNETIETKEITIDTAPATAEHTYYRNGIEITDPIAYVQGVNELTFTGIYGDTGSGLYKDVLVIFRNSDLKAYCGWSQSLTGGTELNGENYQDLDQHQKFTDCIASLDDGEYHVRHRVYDNATRSTAPEYNQHRQYTTLQFVVDNTEPNIFINPSRDPDIGKWYSTRPSYSNIHPTIELTSNEETVFQYKWDNATDWETYSDVINTDVLTNGEHTIYVKATDLAGNINIDELTIWLDFSNPEGGMSIEETNGFVSDDMSINFNNVYDPSGSGEISRIEIWVDGQGYQGNAENLGEGNYRFIFDTTGLGDGTYTVRPSIFDKAGNRTRPSTQFTVDNTAPESTITTPEVNTYYNNPIHIQGYTEDNNGVASVKLSYAEYDSTSDTCGGVYSEITTIQSSQSETHFEWQHDWTPESEGVYCIKAQGTDVVGNEETTAVVQNVVYDITIPEINITIDPENADGSDSWYITRPTLTLTASDNFEVDIIQYQWNSDSEAGWENREDTQISLNAPSEGTNRLYYRAIDKAQNSSEIDETSDTGVYTLHWDATDLTDGPLNVSASPNPTSGSSATVSWDKADDNIGINKYTITWELRDGDDKHSKEVNADVTEITISDLLEGVYKITVRAYDNSGYNKSDSTDLTVDRTAPAAPTLTLEDTRDGEVDLSWTEVEDANDYIILYGLESGNHIYAARVGDITNYTVQGLTAGSYYFVVRAVDKADNQSPNSNEVNSGTILGAVGLGEGVGGPAAGFQEAGEVLGEETETTEQELAEQAPTSDKETGEVLGTVTSVGFFQSKLPWILLGLQALALLIFEAIQRRQQSMLKFAISLGITLVLTGLYYLLRNPEYFAEGSLTLLLNNWYWLVAVGIMILIRMIGYGFIEEVEL